MSIAARMKSINRHEIQQRNIMPITSSAIAAAHLPPQSRLLIQSPPSGIFRSYYILFCTVKFVTAAFIPLLSLNVPRSCDNIYYGKPFRGMESRYF